MSTGMTRTYAQVIDVRPVVADHDLEAERAVLAAVMLDDSGRGVWDEVTAALTPADFYSSAHRAVFEAMARLVDRGVPLDVVTVSAELRAVDKLNLVGGPGALAAMTDDIVTLANVAAHARVVREYALRREVISLARALGARILGGASIGATIAGAIAALDAIVVPGVEAPTMERDVDDYAATIEGDRKPTAPPVPTGIADLDAALFGGLRHGAYYLGGLPGDGKTTLALQMAASIAAHVGPVLFVSKEQDRAAVRDILLAQLARLPLSKVIMARETPTAAPLDDRERDALYRAINALRGLRLRVVDLSTPGCPRTVFDVVAVARAMRPAPVAVFIDNMGELETRGNHGTRTDLSSEEKAKDLRRAKDLLRVPFVTLVHPTQDAVRGKGRLGISDIAGGGAIGRVCDGTIFMHDESRRPTRDHKKDPPAPGMVEIYTAKLRGPVGFAFCEVQRITHEHRFASTRRRDSNGQLIDDGDLIAADPRPSGVRARSTAPTGDGAAIYDAAGDLPDDGAAMFAGESGALDLGPQWNDGDERGAA